MKPENFHFLSILAFPIQKLPCPTSDFRLCFIVPRMPTLLIVSQLKSIQTFLNRNVTFRLNVPPRISLRMFVHLKYIPELPTTKKSKCWRERSVDLVMGLFRGCSQTHIASQLTSRGRVAVAAAELLGRGPTSISCTSSAALRLGATLLWHQNKTTCDFFLLRGSEGLPMPSSVSSSVFVPTRRTYVRLLPWLTF